MDILIQTRKNIWRISRKGITKVPTVNWTKVDSMFTKIISVRKKLIEGQWSANKAGQQLDQVVYAGTVNARTAAVNADAMRRSTEGRWVKK